MDQHELFLSCRRGDVSKVQVLVERKEVDLNIRDKWDSTPLYYACLCGHLELVQYLLANGARCEANTFDGERCLYGALDNEIRRILLDFNVVTGQTMRRDNYEEFLRRLLESGAYSDVSFNVHGHIFTAHKCILSARSAYFCDAFQSKWRHRTAINLTNSLVTPQAFRAILQFIYTGRLETRLDEVEDCKMLAVQCKFLDLVHQLEEAEKRVDSFACTKPGTKVTTLLVESPALLSDLQQDFGILAEQSMPPSLRPWIGGMELPLMPRVPQWFVDTCFVVDNERFYCHKIFFAGRSEYFRALLEDHFEEAEMDEEHDARVLQLHEVSAPVFAHVVHYIYENSPRLTGENVYDVLCAADLYLLPGLKRQCGNVIGTLLDETNVVAVLRTARTFELPRLEDQCTGFIASHLEQTLNDPGLHALVSEDAAEVKGRQETDSIPVIDDIRYHITASVQTYSEVGEANEKLRLIDEMLEDLGLDA